MTEYKPTEYIVDFGDYRSNQFVRLNMALIEQNGAKLGEKIVRCRDCERVTIDYGDHDYREPLWCSLFRTDVSLDGFCAWGREKRSE